LEAFLYERERDLFDLDEVIALYDLTTTYFEGTAHANANAAFGKSKEKRSDCPLVTLALVLDASGLPKGATRLPRAMRPFAGVKIEVDSAINQKPQGPESPSWRSLPMNSMNESALDIKGQEIVDQAYELVGLVELAYREGTAAHVVEKGLFQKLLEMGYQALG
jgi:hypothetical protein